MQSILRDEHDAGLADFSSVLLQTNNRKQPAADRDYEDELSSLFDSAEACPRSRTSSRNLSNVLDKIKDDGPATGRSDSALRSRNQDVVTSFSRKARVQAKVHQQARSEDDIGQIENEGMAATASMSEMNAALQASSDKTGQSPESGSGHPLLWKTLPWFLLLCVVGVFSVMQYRTDISLQRLNAGMTDNAEFYSKQMLTVQAETGSGDLNRDTARLTEIVAGISEQIQKLNTELGEIKSSRSVSETQMMTFLQQKIQPQLDTLKSTGDSVADLLHDLTEKNILPKAVKPAARQRAKVATAAKPADSVNPITRQRAGKKAVVVASKDKKPNESKSQAVTITEGWVVNLASLADRVRARKAYQQLRARGVSALIHEFDKNGVTMYRLSVGGFKSRESAEKFVMTAGRDYGYSSGWIRRG